MLDTVVAICR